MAIVVPNASALKARGEQAGLSDSIESLCSSVDVKNLFMKEFTKLGKDAKLNSFEQVKQFHLEPIAWTVESGLVLFSVLFDPSTVHGCSSPHLRRSSVTCA